MVEQKAA
jgi:hypothetical protein